jgi:sugar lactone lactonase YvrE
MKKFLLSISVMGSMLFASSADKTLHKIIPDKNTVLVNQNYVDNLSKGWNLIGVEHNITDLSILKNVDIAWIYDNKSKQWRVFSNMNDIKNVIANTKYSDKFLTSIPAGSGIWVYRKIDLPKIEKFDYEIIDKNDKEAKVRLKINVLYPKNNNLFYVNKFYDNGKEKNLSMLPPLNNDYSIADINLTGGYHKLTLCEGVGLLNTSSVRYNVCKSIDLSIDLPLSNDKYVDKIDLGFESNALSSDDKYLYAIDRGSYYVYKINPSTKEKEKLFRVSSYPNSLEVYNNYFYVGEYGNRKIVKYDINGTKIASYNVSFPDGLTILNDKIYSVKYDKDGELLVLDTDFNKIGTLDTGVDDVCGLAHDDKYLYVLAESGDIYRIDTETKEKILIFNNQEFIRDGNSDYGIEGITVFNNYLWISYTNDKALYRIDIPLK